MPVMRARAIALNKPGFGELFKVPDENNDNLLIAAGREFVKAATEKAAEFATLGKQPAAAAALTADLDALEAAAAAAQTEGRQETVGATAGIDQKIDEGMKAEKFLDRIMKNVYRNNPVNSPNGKPRVT